MDHQQAIASWLRRRTRATGVFRILGVFALLLLALIFSFATFWVVFGIAWFVFVWISPLSFEVLLIVSGVALVLLFVLSFFTDHRRLEGEMLSASAESPRIVFRSGGLAGGFMLNPLSGGPGMLFRGGGFAPLVLLNPVVYLKLLSYLLLSGPRFFMAAFRLMLQVIHGAGFDAEGCAAVLAHLCETEGRTPFKEAVRALPADRDVPKVLEQLRTLPGVVFLMKSDPPGLTLTEEFRQDLWKIRPPDEKAD